MIPQPDVLIELGAPPLSVRFWAHSQIICQYSGYLRSAVTANALSGQSRTHEKSIFIPNVSVDQFQPLLRYMYSGFLDLTMDNIFGVLLATHVLHMPHALEICRSFLSRMQAQGLMPVPQEGNDLGTQATVKPLVLKPIPNKPQQMPITVAITSPSAPTVLVPSSGSTFQTLHAQRATSNRLIPQPQTDGVDEEVNPKLGVSKTYTNDRKDRMVDTTRSEGIAEVVSHAKAIIDIASCDGPVRFRRVLNKHYNKTAAPYKGAVVRTNPLQEQQFSITSSFHQQMARDINERRLCDDSTSRDTDQQEPLYNFKCAVCKHTFKSEYCYMKHSKRHLIPLQSRDIELIDNMENSNGSLSLPLDVTDGEDKLKAEPIHQLTPTKQKLETKDPACPDTHAPCDVIRQLDMNVQYYPCKICGSKFPSYYFVHKHRKMCHQQLLHNETTVSKSPTLPNHSPSSGNTLSVEHIEN